MQDFYSQFCTAYPESLVPDNARFPYITFNFSASDIFVNTLQSFSIWDKANHTTNIDAIADKIENAVPAIVGTIVKVKDSAVYEWYNPITLSWVEFNFEDFLQLASDFYLAHPDSELQWRKTAGKTVGVLRLFRGTPFIQPIPSPPDERDIVRYYGNIEVRNLAV